MKNGDGRNKNRNEYDLHEGLLVKNKTVSVGIPGFLFELKDLK
jgi:hypothetical protein